MVAVQTAANVAGYFSIPCLAVRMASNASDRFDVDTVAVLAIWMMADDAAVTFPPEPMVRRR